MPGSSSPCTRSPQPTRTHSACSASRSRSSAWSWSSSARPANQRRMAAVSRIVARIRGARPALLDLPRAVGQPGRHHLAQRRRPPRRPVPDRIERQHQHLRVRVGPDRRARPARLTQSRPTKDPAPLLSRLDDEIACAREVDEGRDAARDQHDEASTTARCRSSTLPATTSRTVAPDSSARTSAVGKRSAPGTSSTREGTDAAAPIPRLSSPPCRGGERPSALPRAFPAGPHCSVSGTGWLGGGERTMTSETELGLSTLTVDECRGLLVTHRPRLGRLAFVAGEWPLVLPMNYALDGDVVYFRTAAGRKLFAASRSRPRDLPGRPRRRGVGGRGGACSPSGGCGWSTTPPSSHGSGSSRCGRGRAATSRTSSPLTSTRCPGGASSARACPADHATGSRSQIPDRGKIGSLSRITAVLRASSCRARSRDLPESDLPQSGHEGGRCSAGSRRRRRRACSPGAGSGRRCLPLGGC